MVPLRRSAHPHEEDHNRRRICCLPQGCFCISPAYARSSNASGRPSWTLFSGGICFFFLAAFSWVLDVKGWRRWAFPLVVVGMNSIAAYLIAHLCENFIINSFHIHLGRGVFQVFGTGLEPLLTGIVVLAIFWYMLFWMHKRKIFLRV